MLQQEPFSRDEVLPSWFMNRLQDRIEPLTNFRLDLSSSTTVRANAGSNDDAMVINVTGKWRKAESAVTRTHPGGAAGTYLVFVTAKAQDVVNTPLPNTDNTDYTFALAIVTNGSTPAIVAGTVDIFRRVGRLTWDGAAITALVQEVGAVVGAQLDDAAIVSGGVTATRQPGGGFLFEVAAGAITATKIAASLKPSGSAAAADEALRALGTAAGTAAAGNDGRLSDARAPAGAAGGELAGSYPNPTIGPLAAARVLSWNGDTNLSRIAAGTLGIEFIARVQGLLAQVPRFQWRATDAASDRGRWQFYAHATGLSLTAQNDAETTEYGVMGFGGRTSGTTVGSLTFFSGGSFPTTISNAGLLTLTGNMVRPVVTALPTTGLTDGMEVLLQTAAMVTKGLPPWTFRYRAGGGTYKWEAIGPVGWLEKWRGTAAGSSTTTYAAIGNITTPTSIAAPVPGVYQVEWGMRTTAAASGVPSQETYLVPVAPSDARSQGQKDADAIWTFWDANTGQRPGGAAQCFVTALAAGDLIALQARQTVTIAWPVTDPWMKVTPMLCG